MKRIFIRQLIVFGSGGLFEYLRMPFGLCNSPATFQRFMEVCLSEENFETFVLYLDDILVFSRIIEEAKSKNKPRDIRRAKSGKISNISKD